MNVSQQLHEKELFRKVVCTQVDCSTWNHRLSPNPHVLIIYVELFHACGTAPKRFEECEGENDNVRLHCQTWVLDDAHYHWL